MTETNPLATVSRSVAKRAHLTMLDAEKIANQCKAGLVIPGLEVEIFDEQWNPLPHDGKSVGEVCIRGPWICSEYYDNPQPEKFHDGWLVTGDVGMIDPEEYLILTDRSKDLIKSGGEWISSIDLENHICALPGVAQIRRAELSRDHRRLAVANHPENGTLPALPWARSLRRP